MVENSRLNEEQAWVEERIKNVLQQPYFFRGDKLVIAREDREKVYKRLKDRIWTDRDGNGRLWFYRIVVYHSDEEYVWLRILDF